MLFLLPSLFLFLSSLFSPVLAHGDYLNRTRCFCGTIGAHAKTTPRQAYFYNLTYYNAHLEQSVSLNITCLSWHRHLFPHSCLNYSIQKGKFCTTFPATPAELDAAQQHHHHHNGTASKKAKAKAKVKPWFKWRKHGRHRHHTHRFCYRQRHGSEQGGQDKVYFDEQTRTVPKWGTHLLKADVQRICEPVCQREFGLPPWKGNEYVWSHVDQFELDDMCNGCK